MAALRKSRMAMISEEIQNSQKLSFYEIQELERHAIASYCRRFGKKNVSEIFMQPSKYAAEIDEKEQIVTLNNVRGRIAAARYSLKDGKFRFRWLSEE